jgi:hypothetical protein
METTFENKCGILSDLWLEYREDTEFEDYIKYNDLSLPLAYAVDKQIIEVTDRVKTFVDEGFAMLLDLLSVEDDGFENLDDLFALAAGNLPDGE